MTQTAIKELRLCEQRNNLVNLLKEIGQQGNVHKVISDLSNKYPNSPTTVLRYMTRLKNKASEKIQAMKEQSQVPYLESEQFRQDLAEDLHEDYIKIKNSGRCSGLAKGPIGSLYEYAFKKTFD